MIFEQLRILTWFLLAMCGLGKTVRSAILNFLRFVIVGSFCLRDETNLFCTRLEFVLCQAKYILSLRAVTLVPSHSVRWVPARAVVYNGDCPLKATLAYYLSVSYCLLASFRTSDASGGNFEIVHQRLTAVVYDLSVSFCLSPLLVGVKNGHVCNMSLL